MTTLTRDQVLDKVREHLATEFELDATVITDATRFKEDLDELVMELEDSYGITVSREDTAKITTVGDAVDFVLERLPA